MNPSIAQSRQQAGLSLVELMVGLALGLILMVGVLQVFLTSRQTYANSEAMARLQDNGRFALDMIAGTARLAGYTDPKARIEGAVRVNRIAGSDCVNQPGFKLPNDGACSKDNINVGNGIPTDSIGIALQPPIIDGERRDCLGNIIVDDNETIINYFSIIPPNNTDPANPIPAALGCRAWSLDKADWISVAQPMVEGIDSLQVLYGVDNAGGSTRSPTRYVSANTMITENLNWDDVMAIRISVLANSVNTLTPAPQNRNYVMLDAPPLNNAALGNDNRARQIFSTTIHLKNAN